MSTIAKNGRASSRSINSSKIRRSFSRKESFWPTPQLDKPSIRRRCASPAPWSKDYRQSPTNPRVLQFLENPERKTGKIPALQRRIVLRRTYSFLVNWDLMRGRIVCFFIEANCWCFSLEKRISILFFLMDFTRIPNETQKNTHEASGSLRRQKACP